MGLGAPGLVLVLPRLSREISGSWSERTRRSAQRRWSPCRQLVGRSFRKLVEGFRLTFVMAGLSDDSRRCDDLEVCHVEALQVKGISASSWRVIMSSPPIIL